MVHYRTDMTDSANGNISFLWAGSLLYLALSFIVQTLHSLAQALILAWNSSLFTIPLPLRFLHGAFVSLPVKIKPQSYLGRSYYHRI